MRFRTLRTAEAPEAARRAAVSFGADIDEAAVQVWRERIDGGNVWGLADEADRVLAHGRLSEVDHWLGGRRVPTQHVAAVAVPPEHRGRGVAAEFMSAAVTHGAAHGAGLSLLFPATVSLYRRMGYEHAGVFNRYRLDARKAPASGPPLRPAGTDDWEAIRRCGDICASRRHGPAVRPDERWDQLRGTAYHYVLDGAGESPEIEAYVLFDHAREAGDWQYTLAITDWAASSARGLAAVVGLVGRHGTLGKAAVFRGTVPELWAMLVAEQDVALEGRLWWMGRGLDLAAAVTARGFPPGLAGTASFTVDDPLLPSARGPWRLEVTGGRGALEPCADARTHLDVRGVAPLLTGFRTPRELQLGGLLDGPEDELDWLAGAFAAPTPLLLDFSDSDP